MTNYTVYEIIVSVSKDVNGNDVEKLVSKTPIKNANFTPQFNCTGNALANQMFIINSDQITEQVRIEEGLVEINPSQANTNDVGMYIDNNGIVNHLEIYLSKNIVNTKGGIEENPNISTPGKSDFSVGTYTNEEKTTMITEYKVFRDYRPDLKVSGINGSTTKEGIEVSTKEFMRIKNSVKPKTLTKEEINNQKRIKDKLNQQKSN